MENAINSQWTSRIIFRIGVGLYAMVCSGHLGAVDFGREVIPIFSEKCFQCHGPDEKERKGGLRLDTLAGATKDLGGYAAVVPGKPQESALIDRIEHRDPDEVMPPPSSEFSLSANEKSILREWIESGATYDRHWAFVPPKKVNLPKSSDPITTFVKARLEREGLSLSPPASAETLCRRLYLDLIGLPPSPAEIDSFVAAAKKDRRQAVDALTTRLLESPQYGERWARPWLDVARYADSNGFEKDLAREQWAWRDWVIQSLNDDKPYNEFLIEQIAGDLLPNRSQDQLIATGFLRNGMVNEEGAIIPEQFRLEGVFDRMDCVGKAALGLSLQCAQCHSHKFDPISHDEYYGMFAYLNDTHEAQSWVYSKEQRNTIQQIQSKVDELEKQIKDSLLNWPSTLSAWEESERKKHHQWQPLDFHDHVWEGGLNHPTKLSDSSILVLGHPSVGGSMYMIARPGKSTIAEIRLEALRHGDHPFGGPGRGKYGTFSIAELEVSHREATEADWEKVELSQARVDFATEEREIDDGPEKDKRPRVGPAMFLIDGNTRTGWMPDRGPVLRHTESVVIVTLSKPLNSTPDTELRIRLQLHQGKTVNGRDNFQLGRLRCSVANTAQPEVQPLDHAAWLAIEKPKAQRSIAENQSIFRAWRKTRSDLAQQNASIDALEQTYPEAGTSVLHLSQPPDDLKRTTHLLDRGIWNRPRHQITPHTPEVLHALSTTPKSRLDFARWLAHDDSPLTARVQVNRVWQTLFGAGLVPTAEDFGTRAPRPEYQELLDWLAVDFVERGWHLKSLIKTIVTSRVYQQASQQTLELTDRDPENHWLARGPRFRVDAEMVRDIALSVSGLLHQRVGGPSFYPPVPKSMLDYNYVRMKWPEDEAPDRYRRSLYMFRKRSMPDPVLTSFDAPNADFACARRTRSNTPLAALVPLNESVFVEAARALSLRILREGGGRDETRADYGFRLCTGRPAHASERDELLKLVSKQRTRLADGWLSIDQVAFGEAKSRPELPEGTTPQDAAAWAIAARVLLNLDATIAKH